MGFYDAFKDAVDIAQKADNIDLYRKLLDLSKDALDLQNEVYKLTEENKQLKAELNRVSEMNDLENDLELTKDGFYIRISEREEGKNIQYCAACWQNNKKLMPFIKTIGGVRQCSNCHTAVR